MLQKNLDKAKFELDKNLKWTSSSQIMFKIHGNHRCNKKGLGHTKVKIPYNPHSKYVDIPNNRFCTHCGNSEHLRNMHS